MGGWVSELGGFGEIRSRFRLGALSGAMCGAAIRPGVSISACANLETSLVVLYPCIGMSLCTTAQLGGVAGVSCSMLHACGTVSPCKGTLLPSQLVTFFASAWPAAQKVTKERRPLQRRPSVSRSAIPKMTAAKTGNAGNSPSAQTARVSLSALTPIILAPSPSGILPALLNFVMPTFGFSPAKNTNGTAKRCRCLNPVFFTAIHIRITNTDSVSSCP